MPNLPPPPKAASTPIPREHDALAGLLSYLIPGLGQVYQGRIGKGILFFVCIYALFFYGMHLGHWKNVYLADTAALNNPWQLPRVAANLWNRPQFAAQFWVGIATWPAVTQYLFFDETKNSGPLFGDYQRTPSEDHLNDLQRTSDKTWDLGWVFTVIAGVLNIMVIYDAVAGPAFLIRNPPGAAEA